MTTHANKDQETTNAVAAHASDTYGQVPQWSDNRPQAALQLKWQSMADNSPRIAQLKSYQNLANQGIQRMSLEEEEPLQGKFKTVQRVGGMEEEELLQGKFKTVQRVGGMEEEELLQGKFKTVQRKENNTGLPDNLKSGVESLSGISMDDVRVHYNSDRPAPLQAHAFAQGSDIHVASGQEKHLAHEAWHVVQQKQGRVQPTMSLHGQSINDSPSLEKEADDMGAKSLNAVPQQLRRKKP